MTTLLVTGVSGALGSRVLPLLAADPSVDRIIGVDRRPLSVSAPKLQFLQADIVDGATVTVLGGVDVVVHLAASADVRVLRNLLIACGRAHVKHIVVRSSAVVYGAWPTNAVPLSEDAPLRPNPSFEYATQVAEAERLLAQWQTDHPDTTVTVLRLAAIVGGGLERVLEIALGGVHSHREERTGRPVQFLHIDDAVRAIHLAVQKPMEGIFNVAPRGFVGDAIAREVAGAPPRPAIPRRMADFFNRLTWRVRYRSDFYGAQPYLQYPWVVSSDRLLAEGWTPAYTTEEALVAEAKPTWWSGLRTGQRRAIITGGIAVGTLLGTASGAVGSALLLRRARNSRS
jgi:nucleoside-diphosphate-sugar epimerase